MICPIGLLSNYKLDKINSIIEKLSQNMGVMYSLNSKPKCCLIRMVLCKESIVPV